MSPKNHEPAFNVTIGRTDAGSPVLDFAPSARELTRPQEYRVLNALIYDVAATLERRCADLNAPWVISPEAYASRLVVELLHEREAAAAESMIAQVLAAKKLA